MNTPLQALVVEDSADDTELMVIELRQAGFEVTTRRVDTPEAMRAALENQAWDVVLCDHALPHFNSDAALALVKELGIDIPFIIVSGTIGEEHAVAAMRSGCHDYVLKNNMKRLAPVVHRELQEAEVRRAHRQAEAALRESLQSYADIVHAIPSGLFIYQYEPPDRLVLLDCNPEAEHLMGVKLDIWYGREFNELWPPDYVNNVKRAFLDVIETGRTFKTEDLCFKDGYFERFSKIRAFRMPGKRLGVAFEDVTERKRAEKALRESEEKMRAQYKCNPVPTYTWQMVGNDLVLVDFNDAAKEITQGGVINFVGKKATEMYQDRPKIIEELIRCVSEKTVVKREMPYYFKTMGQTKDLAVSYSFVPPNLVMVHTEDITERKRVEEALRASEEEERRFQKKLRDLIEVGNELTIVESFDDLCRRVVELGRSRLGFDRVGIWFLGEKEKPNIIHGTFGTDENGELRDERGRSIDISAYEFYPFVTSRKPNVLIGKGDLFNDKGQVVGTGEKACATIWDGQKVVGFIMVDNLIRSEQITERQCELLALYASTLGYLCSRKWGEQERSRLEVQLQQAQKMESLGVLAGGIAHDFNNLLMVISGNAQFLQSSLSLDSASSSALKDIEIAARHAADMTRSLQSFSRPTKPLIRHTDANDLIHEAYRLLRRAIHATIEFCIDPDPSPCIIAVDPGQMQQVLVNLCVNSRDAMPDGGVLEIQTRRVGRESLPPRADQDTQHDKYVRIRVSDNGCGMDKDTLRQAFDPFFSTKPKDRGSGLGLAIVYKIVQAHNGLIDIASQPGKGTRFDIFLPRSESAPIAEAQYPIPAACGEECILVVEDEEMIASLLKTMLESRGYKVAVANRPAEAIEFACATKERIDLAIIDYALPTMTGDRCLNEIRQKRPDLKAIIITGYGIEEENILSCNCRLIHKPFSVPVIARMVRDMLDESNGD